MTGAREQVMLHDADPASLIAKVIGEIADRTGPKTVEVEWDRVGTPLGDDEQPGPDDRIRWTCTAVYARRGKLPQREIVGEHIVEPGENRARGGLLSAIALLEKLGANVIFLDLGGDR